MRTCEKVKDCGCSFFHLTKERDQQKKQVHTGLPNLSSVNKYISLQKPSLCDNPTSPNARFPLMELLLITRLFLFAFYTRKNCVPAFYCAQETLKS